MERLAKDSRNQGLLALELHCRRDFDANAMWGNVEFIPWGEKPGRASSGTILTLWRRELAQSDQMELVFDGAGHAEIDVVMDAQVLFDLETPDDDAPAAPSKALLSDFLADELNLRITDETLVEIDRDDDDERRNRSRQAALRFPQVAYVEIEGVRRALPGFRPPQSWRYARGPELEWLRRFKVSATPSAHTLHYRASP